MSEETDMPIEGGQTVIEKTEDEGGFDKEGEGENSDAVPPPDFDGIMKQLEGTTVLVQPRVSRETILSVMREHTGILRALQTGFIDITEMMKVIQEKTAANSKRLDDHDGDVVRIDKSIEEISGRCDTFRTELDQINNTLTDVYKLKQEMREQKFALEDLTGKFKAHVAEIDEFLQATETKLSGMDALNKETQFKLTELKEYVDHFGDNLILSSSQITVESAIGFSARPTALRDVLKTINKGMASTNETLEDYETRISENTDTVATKADATLVTDVLQINTRVQTIEAHLKKEEETGISAIRKSASSQIPE